MNEKLIINIIKFTPLSIIIFFLIIFYFYAMYLNIGINVDNIVVVISVIFVLFLFLVSLYIAKLIESIFIKYKIEVLNKEKVKFVLKLQEIQDVLDELPFMILYKDTEEKIISVNKAMLTSLSIPLEKILNKSLKEIFPKRYEEYSKKDSEVLENSNITTTYIEEFDIKDKILIVETSRIPVFDDNNKVKSLIVVRNDITERIKLEEETRKKDKLMHQQNKMAVMGEMIGNIAHQWRQPLSIITTVSTGTKLQKEMGELSESELYDAMDKINASAQYLSQTIDDFRNFFKPNNNKKCFFDIIHTFEQTFKILDSQFRSNNITIIKDLDNLNINSLENELVQVLINILNNSRDILIQREVENKLILIKCSQNNGQLSIEVKDNGGGIKEDIIDKIFEPYFTTKHQYQGTGLGLYMSLEIVTKLLNGTLKAENESFSYNGNYYTGAKFIIKLKQ